MSSKNVISILLLNFLVTVVSGQYLHVSNAGHADIFINPAHTGIHHYMWSSNGTIRNQWKSLSQPFETKWFEWDHLLFLHHEKLAYGFMVIGDQSGPTGIHSSTLGVSVAYHKKVDYHLFHLGVQASLVRRSGVVSEYTTPLQYDHNIGGFNADLPSYENAMDAFSYAALNVGLIWSLPQSSSHPEIGFALHQVNRPNLSYSAQEKMAVKTTLHGKFNYHLSEYVSFEPAFIFSMMGGASDFLLAAGMAIQPTHSTDTPYKLYGSIGFRDGVQRNADAVVLNMGFRHGRIGIGACFDYNVSALGALTNGFGSLEINLSYQGGVIQMLQTERKYCTRE